MDTSTNLGTLKHMRGAIVVSAGGHLEQALRRVDQLGISKSVTFFTPKNSQTESKLANIEHVFIPNVPSRDITALLIATFGLLRNLSKKDYDYVLSTGAAVAIAGYIVSKLRGIDFYYIESIARQDNPSFTGKILRLLKVKNLYSESQSSNFRKWKKIDSVFSEYHFVPKDSIKNRSLKLFVTMGTVHQFKFFRMVNLVNSVIEDGDEVVWQVGDLQNMKIVGESHREMSDKDFIRNIQSADAVISHAGVGSILKILDSGKIPVIIPRLAQHEEHIDNHQFEISMMLKRLNLGVVVTESLTRENLLFVANQIVTMGKDD